MPQGDRLNMAGKLLLFLPWKVRVYTPSTESKRGWWFCDYFDRLIMAEVILPLPVSYPPHINVLEVNTHFGERPWRLRRHEEEETHMWE
jgi:hypothetical protein